MSTTPKPLYAITKTTPLQTPPPPSREGATGGHPTTSTEIHAVYADREAANRAARSLLREEAARAGRLGRHGNPTGRYEESMGRDLLYLGGLDVDVQEGEGRIVEVRVLGVPGYL